MITAKRPLTNVQMELLKLYSMDISDEQLLELQDVIARFFFDKTRDEADKIWEERGYTEETVRKWLEED